MIVLSLFDGISGGLVAMERAGLPVTKYYSSEIEERIADITDYEGDYPERDYVEPYSNVKDVSDDVIVDMFNSLRN